MSTIKSLFVFLIQLVFDFYLYLLILRLLMQKLSINWSNPVTQMVIKVTEPVLKPLRRYIPGFKGFDLSILVLALVIAMVQQLIVVGLSYGFMPRVLGLIMIAAITLVNKALYCFIFAIIVSALISWFPRLQGGPLSHIVNTISEPCLRLPRRFIPLIGGFDVSPVVALLVLYWLSLLFIQPLMAMAIRWSL